MLTRFLVPALSLSLVFAAPLPLLAQDLAQPEVENARQSFAGVVNAAAVYVRSGPGDNYYPTLRVDKGQPVTVVGIRFDWLKIEPPEGSFCYIAKAYVEKRGDGSVGRVTRPDVNVRAGSNISPMKSTVQAKLPEGVDVQILGEQDEYFKIAPPEGAYLYIHKQFVDPVKPLATDTPKQEPTVAENTPPAAETPAETPVEQAPAQPENPAVADATTQPSNDTSADAEAADQPAEAVAATDAPSTQPALSAEAQFDALEQEFLTISAKPVDEQPIPELLAKYEAIAKNEQLPASLHRIVDLRVSTLKVRSDAREQLLAIRKIREENEKRQLALKAEREELEERIKANEVKLFTAVGTLQTSSLQKGDGVLYRLTDPDTGRTLVYVRTTDEKIRGSIGQFVGIKGELVEDAGMAIKFINPTSWETVDPSKVGTNVAAELIPPSLLPRPSAASAE